MSLQLQDQAKGIRDSAKAQENQQEAITSAVSFLHETNNERIEEQRTEERRHTENLTQQRWLTGWTCAAFAAAAIYAFFAYFQLRTTNATYVEIRSQTNAAQWSAYSSCMSANAAIDTLKEIKDGESDTHSTTIATIYQSEAAIKSQTANVLISFPSTATVQTSPDDPGKYMIQIPESIKNWGNTPAAGLHLEIRVEFIPMDQAIDFSYNKENSTIGYLPRMKQNEALPSETKSPFPVAQLLEHRRRKDISRQEWEVFLEGKTHFVAIGRVTYDDIFNKKHWSQTCFLFDSPSLRKPNDTISFGDQKCTDYNKSDSSAVLPIPSRDLPKKADSIQNIDCKKPPDN
ncbi:hypothetical protein [Terracidiphilus sp.]|uniref:hypothetical protein n=1 Tax=Terracidiphilus sp. TaxID=1964191 RepID=UPI003C175A08